MKKIMPILAVVCLLLAIAGGVGTFYFRSELVKANKEMEQMDQANASLQMQNEAIGPVVTAYTVNVRVKGGHDINAELEIVPQSIPQSSVNESTITDLAQLDGKYWKVDISPGTTLTTDLIMDSGLDRTVYEQDMIFDYIPLGLEVGDYIDILITCLDGETYNVMTHKRVEFIDYQKKLIKMYLTDVQMAIWESANTDKAMYSDVGLRLYMVQYMEPGIHDNVRPFYSVRSEMKSVLDYNPNVVGEAKNYWNKDIRTHFDYILACDYEETKTGSGLDSTKANSVMGGYSDYSSTIDAMHTLYEGFGDGNPANGMEGSAGTEGFDGEVPSGTLQEVTGTPEQVEDELSEDDSID